MGDTGSNVIPWVPWYVSDTIEVAVFVTVCWAATYGIVMLLRWWRK
jgi:hypothetical protein